MKVLITYGGMLEKIDGVRSISNTSSGNTGVVIANYFSDHGAEVMVLKGKHALSCDSKIISKTFTGFDDLEKLLGETLQNTSFDAVIHLAAVSDYKVDRIKIGEKVYAPENLQKLDSGDEITLTLKKTPKLICKIKDHSSDVTLVGFKLTNSEDLNTRQQAIQKLRESCDVDYIVHNDLSEISKDLHRTTIYDGENIYKKQDTKEQLAKELFNLIERRL